MAEQSVGQAGRIIPTPEPQSETETAKLVWTILPFNVNMYSTVSGIYFRIVLL